MCKVVALIGDNATGKTRYLKEVLNKALKNTLRVVTNIPKYEKYNSKKLDTNKVKNIDDLGNDVLDSLIAKSYTFSLTQAEEMMKLLAFQGDVLVLDEVDLNVERGELTMLMAAISESKECWEEIYISGYNPLIDRVFINEDKEDFTTTYDPNFYYVETENNKLTLKYIPEDKVYEYFDSL